MVAHLQVALPVESQAHVPRVMIPIQELYWVPDGADVVDEQRYQLM
jgi:hypothetical protein